MQFILPIEFLILNYVVNIVYLYMTQRQPKIFLLRIVDVFKLQIYNAVIVATRHFEN